jgi:serine protease Do
MRRLIKVAVLLLVGFAVGVFAVRNRAAVPAGGSAAPSRPAEVAAGSASETHGTAQAPSVTPVAFAEGGTCSQCALPDFTELAAKLQDSVVNISTSSKPGGSGEAQRGQRRPKGPRMPGAPEGPGGGGEDPHEFFGPFERFFDGPLPRRRMPQRSLGSGFIFDPAGYILTNNHVVENADEITVKLHDGEEVKAQLVGRDAKTDVAVLRIETKKQLPAVVFGDSEALKVGEWVMAIGNPFGLESSVTAGIVSAKGRFIGQGNYDDFIQTDAPINPGNSGGPLIDMHGKVVGINTSIFSRTGGNIGIGFAIPINLARDLIPDLRDKGHVTRGWLGVMIQKVTPDIAESLRLPAAKGALVADVVKDGPAGKAGIKTGDVIVSFDGHVVKESTELPLLVARTPIGRQVEVKVLRDGEEQTLSVAIAEMKEEDVAGTNDESEAYGLTVQNITPEIAESLGIGVDVKGVLVAGVESGSAAEEAGLRRGDVIVEVNRQPVPDVDAYTKAIGSVEAGKSVLLLVRRGENTVFLALKPPPASSND